MTALELGARYTCFEDFQAALAKYSRDTNSIYTVFNSKSIETENRGRLPDKQYPPALKYRFIKYTCKHYGNIRSKSRGLRPNQSSFKIGCPAFIYLSVQKNQLVVEKMEANHSHVCDPDVINLYPERRSISERTKLINLSCTDGVESELIKSVREDVVDLLRLHIDRRRIRNYVRLRTGKILMPADLSNFAKQMQAQEKEVSEERSYQLLDMLTALESKENAPARMLEDLAKKEKYKSLKRKIIRTKADLSTLGEGESESGNNVQEHDYSNPPKRAQTSEKWWEESKNHDLSGHLPGKREITVRSQGIEWDPHTLEEMVKTINPNEEGPVLVHMNNYDGVMVVEIQNGQGAVTQLEGTVVEVEDDLPDDSTHLADTSLEESCDYINEKLPDGTPQKKKQESLGKKKIIQFRRRENKPEPALISSGKNNQKNLIDLAMESAECNPKVEDSESMSAKDLMDSQSDDGSDNAPVFVDCTSADECNDDGGVEFVGPALKYTEKTRTEAEVEMLRVKTSKLKLQVKYLKQKLCNQELQDKYLRKELNKQELEMEKLRLEILLLKARITVNEIQ